MEDIISTINDITNKINKLESERSVLNSEITKEKRKLLKMLKSKKGWYLFIAEYCVYGDKESYVQPIDYYIKNGFDESRHCPQNSNLSILLNENYVEIDDYYTYGYDGHEDWTFRIPLTKFIEFCSCDDYMQRRIDRLKSIRNVREEKAKQEEAERERQMYLKLKEKYETTE